MKKLVSCVMLSGLILTTLCFGASFSDVADSHWAKSAIDEMVSRKIVSGYTDNTFRPKREISKIEMIIILSRTLGMQDDTASVDKYLADYTETLSKYTTTYKKEVAYLMGKGVITSSDLENLIGGTNANTPLKRSEMAVLITKLFKKEAEVKNKSFVVLPFDDSSSIDSSFRPYIEFVYNEKIMQGMDGKFSPDTAVTRAQAAVMVVSILPKIDDIYAEKPVIEEPTAETPAESVYEGDMVTFNKTQKTITVSIDKNNEIFEYDSNTEIYLNGVKANDSAFKIGVKTKIKMLDDAVTRIDITRTDVKDESKTNTSKLADDVEDAYGEIISIIYNDDDVALIIDDEDEGKITLMADDDTTYYLDKIRTNLSEFKTGDVVTIEADDGYITMMKKKLKSTSREIKGTLADYDEDDYEIYVELESGAEITVNVEDAYIYDYTDKSKIDYDELDELDDYLDGEVYVFGKVNGKEFTAKIVVIAE